MAALKVLVINPGSQSTKLAVYEQNKPAFSLEIPYTQAGFSAQQSIIEQLPSRLASIENALAQNRVPLSALSAIAARGAPLEPVPGGTYRVNETMLQHARSMAYIDHASKLGCLIADALARRNSGAPLPAFVTDPVSVDEYEPVSRISGVPELERKSMTHALNIKAVARRFAHDRGQDVRELKVIIAHMGGGISIAALSNNRIIDSVDANGEGPMSAERSGGLRVDSLVDLCFSGAEGKKEIKARLTRNAGLLAHLGTTDLREIETRISKGDTHAARVLQAMSYQIAKQCVGLTVALGGKADAILLTGGMARSTILVQMLEKYLQPYAPVAAFPGEDEMLALYEGTKRVLLGQEQAKLYPSGRDEKDRILDHENIP